MPRDLCGAVRFDGLDGEGSRGIAAHGHRRAMEGLFPALRELAADLGERFLAGLARSTASPCRMSRQP